MNALPRPQKTSNLGVAQLVESSLVDADAKRAYDRAYHANRSPEQKAHKIKLQQDRQLLILAEVRAFKASKGCMDCGESDPIVLDFDHRDRAEKSLTIGNAARIGHSVKTLMAEAEKCDVVCANCHRRRTAKALWRDTAGSSPATQTNIPCRRLQRSPRLDSLFSY